MPGSSPGEAVHNILDPIKGAIECVGSGHLQFREHPPLGSLQTATLNAGEGLTVPAAGAYAPSLTISIELVFVPIHCPEDEERGPYRCRQAGYILALGDAERKELVAYHWHPMQQVSPEVKPHMHVGESRLPQGAKLHVPTPRTSVETFLTVAIETFGARPLVDREVWEPIMTGSQERYEIYRSWSNRDDSPSADDLTAGPS